MFTKMALKPRRQILLGGSHSDDFIGGLYVGENTRHRSLQTMRTVAARKLHSQTPIRKRRVRIVGLQHVCEIHDRPEEWLHSLPDSERLNRQVDAHRVGLSNPKTSAQYQRRSE